METSTKSFWDKPVVKGVLTIAAVIALIFVLSLAAGCKAHSYIASDITKDSTNVTTIIQPRDTTIRIKSSQAAVVDSSLIKAYAKAQRMFDSLKTITNSPCPPCPKIVPERKVTHSGSATNVFAISPTGLITDTCHCDTAAIKIVLKDKIIKEYQSHEEAKVAIQEVKTHFWYDRIAEGISVLAIIALIVFVAITALKSKV